MLGVLCVTVTVYASGGPPATPIAVTGVAHKGSLLVFPMVELRWADDGTLLQDTVIELTNDHPSGVDVQMYMVNGDEPLDEVFVGFPVYRFAEAEPGWNHSDCRARLTGNQPVMWSAARGNPDLCNTFEVLDPPAGFRKPGRPDPEADGLSRVLRGYLVVWAVRYNSQDNQWEEINWNHLTGMAMVVDYENGTSWQYSAQAFQAIAGSRGASTGSPGVLNLDGREYAAGYDRLVLDFLAAGSDRLSRGVPASPGSIAVTVDTDLTLHPLSVDLRQDNDGPVVTKAEFEIWNEHEVKFSGTRRCITCWDQQLLSDYIAAGSIPNHFLITKLGTDKGKARINGVASTECDDGAITSVDASLLGVASRILYFNGGAGKAMTGMNIVGMGDERAAIQYDILTAVDESQGGDSNAGGE